VLGDGGVQSRAQREEASGIQPCEEAPIGAKGQLGRCVTCRAWLESQVTITNVQCILSGRQRHGPGA
jgi:hypothetical protein